MIKNILLLMVGMVFGGGLVGGTMYYMYSQNILPTAIDTLGISDANPFTDQELQSALDIKPVKVIIPQTVVSQNYNTLMQNIINGNNNIAKNNNEVIYPILINLRDRAKDADWQGVFEVILKAKNAIDANIQLTSTMKDNVYKLQTENLATTKNDNLRQQTQLFAQSALNNTAAYDSYFETLKKFVSGSVPTKALGDELNTKIANLTPAQVDFQKKTSATFDIIESLTSENSASTSNSVQAN